jgi:cellulose biosynthesis protein BcsQ
MTTLAVYSNKGGVGKTAAAVNLSYLAAQAGYQTLICDLDPQSSATYYFRVKPKLKPAARGLTRASKWVDRSIKGSDYRNLDLLPADFSHRNLDIIFNELKRSKQRLSRVLEPLKKSYDLVILDCPPTINILAENIFYASDYLLVPVIPTTLSVRTYQQLLSFLKKNDFDLGMVYAFISMIDRRKKMHNELARSMSSEFQGILDNSIPYLSAIERMGIERQPVPAYMPTSVASQAYNYLWLEIQDKMLSKKVPAKFDEPR